MDQSTPALALPPLVYTITITDSSRPIAEVTLDIPAPGAGADLRMATWSPGFYRAEDYASRVHAVTALADDGSPLTVMQTAANRWRVDACGAQAVRVRYRLECSDSSVTTNWVGDGYALLNGPATYLAVAGAQARAHRLLLALPDGWQALVALPAEPGGGANAYVAASFDALADAPILAGAALERHDFAAAGASYTLAAAGRTGILDLTRAAHDLARVAEANLRLWRQRPFERYLFLAVCREGGGGLEHAESTVVTAVPTRLAEPAGYPAWVRLASHEYFHAFNVKRLRPRELGPFDYERPARTRGLWVAEGLTCYYTDLLLCRAGIWSPDQLLAGLSDVIAQLQGSAGRRVQTLEESSLAVWENSFSGLRTGDDSVSYYVKGHVVGFLLDVHIRRATGGARSLDDLMRLAFERFSGDEGFTPEGFARAACEVAGYDITGWLAQAVASTDELAYGEALGWLGLAFAGGAGAWQLQIDALSDTEAAERRAAWLGMDSGQDG